MFGWLPSSFKGGTSEKSGAKEKRGLPRELVKVVVVHSHTGGKKMWEFLEKNWQECGTVKLALSHQRFVHLFTSFEQHSPLVTPQHETTGTSHSRPWLRPTPMSSSAPILPGLFTNASWSEVARLSLSPLLLAEHHTSTQPRRWTTSWSSLRTAPGSTSSEHTRRSTTRKGIRQRPTSTTTESLPDCLALTRR